MFSVDPCGGHSSSPLALDPGACFLVFGLLHTRFCPSLPAMNLMYVHGEKVVASAEELVFALTMLPLALMVGLGIFRVDWVAVATPPAASEVDWRLFIQIMFWTSTYWQKVRKQKNKKNALRCFCFAPRCAA